ncbi:MAG: D-alanyl-D-alanine carboxypeptidase family protein [Alphaproteobacteria bacterium]|nr:D-alanyl-D-alanine carboxypeptidase family protein [Alphaproteobacteria bacterium]
MKKNRLCIFVFLLAGLATPALAQNATPVETAAKQAFIIDANTGTVLYAKEAEAPMPTSSMSKMMTMYMVFDALKSGKLKMTDMLPTSERAWKQEGSRMFLNVGQEASVEDLIRGVAVQSGNDAAVSLAEALGSGSEYTFADMMNAKAKELGMANSHFMNATGLPDAQHYASPHDLAILALALIRDFPEHYHYFSEREFTYNKIKQGNRNPLLYRNMNVDGLKTGHAEEAGYGLTVSAVRSGWRLVMVLNGLKNMQNRADESARLLDWAYREFGLYPVARAGEKITEAQVWLGEEKTVPLTVGQNVEFTLPRNARPGLKAVMNFDQPIPAPITKGQEIGKLTVTAPGMEAKELPLLAGADVPRLGFFARLGVKLRALFGRE